VVVVDVGDDRGGGEDWVSIAPLSSRLAVERASSSRIVARPTASPSAAPVAPERLRVKVSSSSTAASPTTDTGTVRVTTPGSKVRVPAAAA
jgi:hypothetical protein